MTNAASFICHKCNTRVETEFPVSTIANTPIASTIIARIEPVVCPNPKCLARYIPTITEETALSFLWVDAPAQFPWEKSITVPGSGSRIIH